eukprot:2143720-Rhodomonas_salina.9
MVFESVDGGWWLSGGCHRWKWGATLPHQHAEADVFAFLLQSSMIEQLYGKHAAALPRMRTTLPTPRRLMTIGVVPVASGITSTAGSKRAALVSEWDWGNDNWVGACVDGNIARSLNLAVGALAVVKGRGQVLRGGDWVVPRVIDRASGLRIEGIGSLDLSLALASSGGALQLGTGWVLGTAAYRVVQRRGGGQTCSQRRTWPEFLGQLCCSRGGCGGRGRSFSGSGALCRLRSVAVAHAHIPAHPLVACLPGKFLLSRGSHSKSTA